MDNQSVTEPLPMRVVNLQAENIKRLVAIDITPDSSLVQITGKNGAGKTSVLDAIWWALAGQSNIQDQPIRKGADSAIVRLNMGELVITRKFARKKDGGYTTSIAVENADGAQFKSPQTMLDGLLGELSLDPLEFARMRPREQFDALRKFVPEIDFEAEQEEYEALYQERRDMNRDKKKERSAASLIVLPDDCPTEHIDTAALSKELTDAVAHNANIRDRKHRREAAAEKIKDMTDRIKAEESELAAYIKAANERTAILKKDVSDLQEKLANAGELPESIDISGIQESIANADSVNKAVDLYLDKTAHESNAKELEIKVADIEMKMKQWQESRDQKLADAKLPIDGLSFSDNEVLLDGLPFNQASDAQQLQVSVAMAMAASPTLRIIRIRDGSLLDDDAMALLSEMADGEDYQIWIERVDASGKVGFVIEDGSLKDAKPKEKEESAKKPANKEPEE